MDEMLAPLDEGRMKYVPRLSSVCSLVSIMYSVLMDFQKVWVDLGLFSENSYCIYALSLNSVPSCIRNRKYCQIQSTGMSTRVTPPTSVLNVKCYFFGSPNQES